MDKRKVQRFKNKQKQLAKEIAEAHGITKFTIDYVQIIPSAYTDFETGNLRVGDKSQYIFPTTVIRKGKHRLFVIMQFQGVYDFRVSDKILKRHYWMKYTDDGFEIKISFNPHTIAKF